MTKKMMYWIGGGVFCFVLCWQLFTDAFGDDSKASLFMDTFSADFSQALVDQDRAFFESLSVSESDIDVLMSDITVDKTVVWDAEYLFFSFLKKSDTSSVLETVYGYWNNDSQTFVLLPDISLGVMTLSEKSVMLTNTSSVAFPVDDLFFLYPGNHEGVVEFSGKLVHPGDSLVFVSEKFLPEQVFVLESLKYGFRATVE